MGKEFSLVACHSRINSEEKFHQYKVNVHASTNAKCTNLDAIIIKFYQQVQFIGLFKHTHALNLIR